MDTEALETPETTPQERGVNAEGKLARKLSAMGYFVRRMPYNAPFDLLVNDMRVEVKHSMFKHGTGWVFNIHRHNILDESKVDAYIFVLDGRDWGMNQRIYIVRSAPIGVKTVLVTLNSMVGEDHQHVANWTILGSPIRETITPQS